MESYNKMQILELVLFLVTCFVGMIVSMELMCKILKYVDTTYHALLDRRRNL